MHYLTVQDMLWINLQLTKQINRYEFARLEEATYYQYGYGTSKSLTAQATRFLTGFSKLAPFSAGSKGSAFVGFVAFLRLNDADLNVKPADVVKWVESALANPAMIESCIAATHSHEHGHNPPTRQMIQSVLTDYAAVLAIFSDSVAA